MIVRVITPPAPVVTWEIAQKHLRCPDFEQAYVEQLIAAATSWIDGPGGWLGQSIGEQTLELIYGAFPAEPLPFGPVIEIVSINYRDGNGTPQTVAPEDYELLADGTAYSSSWPSANSSPNAVRVQYRAGYPDLVVAPVPPATDPTITSTVPAAIVQAILLLIGHWFANRAEVVTGTIATQVPVAATDLLSPFRSWRA